ncbi:MAG: hypothetical protein A3K10_03700 [Bacteroidetes bacterium RIFCSPLOWO2_12_FULL_31_6]|nr:MAG: hypothetical protein A3K10_03700 [Bacteroidetes bacterium RIFCSPLOWO2_12_FULL_31_6]
MIQIDNTLISDEVLEKKFVCDLAACKGACCVEGESGAPIEEEEKEILDRLFPKIKPYLRPEGISAIDKQGKYLKDQDGDVVTPLIDGKECAYVVFDNGVVKCGIEKAYKDGAIDFIKPISCHLFPVRIAKTMYYQTLNYERIKICRPATRCGNKLNVAVYKFLKEPLVRKFGEKWYSILELAVVKENENKITND